MKTTKISINLPNEVLRKLKRLSFEYGVGYQLLIKVYIKEGLRKDYHPENDFGFTSNQFDVKK